MPTTVDGAPPLRMSSHQRLSLPDTGVHGWYCVLASTFSLLCIIDINFITPSFCLTSVWTSVQSQGAETGEVVSTSTSPFHWSSTQSTRALSLLQPTH